MPPKPKEAAPAKGKAPAKPAPAAKMSVKDKVAADLAAKVEAEKAELAKKNGDGEGGGPKKSAEIA